MLKSIIDKVTNCLLEWTLELEKNGILGENMTFSKSESASAKELSQQINNYYGPVVNGNLSNSQMVSGNNNTITFNDLDIPELISTIRKSLETETISKDDMETALEILDDVYDKFEKKEKTWYNKIRPAWTKRLHNFRGGKYYRCFDNSSDTRIVMCVAEKIQQKTKHAI